MLRSHFCHRPTCQVRNRSRASVYYVLLIRRFREVQDELYERKGIRIPMTRVIMTSDEGDDAWWEEVAALGWVRMNHDEQRTAERYGRWYVCSLSQRHLDVYAAHGSRRLVLTFAFYMIGTLLYLMLRSSHWGKVL